MWAQQTFIVPHDSFNRLTSICPELYFYFSAALPSDILWHVWERGNEKQVAGVTLRLKMVRVSEKWVIEIKIARIESQTHIYRANGNTNNSFSIDSEGLNPTCSFCNGTNLCAIANNVFSFMQNGASIRWIIILKVRRIAVANAANN